MALRITAPAAIALLVSISFSFPVWSQSTTPGGGPNPSLHDYVHPPLISAPNANERASSAAPKSSSPTVKKHNVQRKTRPPSGSSAPK
jgi:hypothetical protein